ncbi:hypothetical protein [Georgenia subflava]|uniref:Uncharacterized protein n=1 Tax=Georgenia subflava TaxID=1622177 RepID=A0A6N7EH42_9MICO|nr:hypothetical protein [Georgenia subflava]MPV35466.1 hypothetical protein [Georgenia subflava]
MSAGLDGERLPSAPLPGGQVLDARLHLLDRQVLDVDGVPVTTVDDIDVAGIEVNEGTRWQGRATAAGGATAPAGGAEPAGRTEPPHIAALLTGPVLGARIFGGRPPRSRWVAIRWADVRDVGIVVSLAVRGEGLEATWQERWFRDHVIGRIPGAGHAPD